MAAVYKSLSRSEKQSKSAKPQSGPVNRQRVLLLSSRGVTFRQRHLLKDLYSLLPHSRKDAKLDTKTKLYQLNELAELYNCNNVLYLEARKGKDLYVWMSKAPNGPTVKMHLQNCMWMSRGVLSSVLRLLIPLVVHTMSELHFPGNCLKGSRPILSFDATFDSQPHLLVIKELLSHIFGVPPSSRKTKPFIDHVLSFTLAAGKIWIRCFQISESEATAEQNTQNGNGVSPSVIKSGGVGISLVEIGPRFVLTPIVILESSFGGPKIYENREFVSPNQLRSDIRKSKAGRYNTRNEAALESKAKRGDLGLRTGVGERPVDELDNHVLFA